MDSNQTAIQEYISSEDNLLVLGASVKLLSDGLISMSCPQTRGDIVGLRQESNSRCEVLHAAKTRVEWLRKMVTQSTIPSTHPFLIVDSTFIQYLWIDNQELGVAGVSYEMFRKPTILVGYNSRGKFRIQKNFQLYV